MTKGTWTAELALHLLIVVWEVKNAFKRSSATFTVIFVLHVSLRDSRSSLLW